MTPQVQLLSLLVQLQASTVAQVAGLRHEAQVAQAKADWEAELRKAQEHDATRTATCGWCGAPRHMAHQDGCPEESHCNGCGVREGEVHRVGCVHSVPPSERGQSGKVWRSGQGPWELRAGVQRCVSCDVRQGMRHREGCQFAEPEPEAGRFGACRLCGCSMEQGEHARDCPQWTPPEGPW